MSSNEITVGAAVDDVDDVEAHGMREVVVGVSAAAVLTGGAAAVMQSQGNGEGGAGTIHATSALEGERGLGGAASSSASRAAEVNGPASFSTTGESAGSLAQSTLRSTSGALAGTTDAAEDVVSPNRTLVQRTDDRVDGAIDQARDVRDSAFRTTRSVLDATRETVKNEVRDARTAVREAPQTVRDVVDEASSGTITTPNVREITDSARNAVDSTLVLAGDTTRGLTAGAMTTIARVQPGVSGEISPQDASGWVSVTVGGKEIARAAVVDGQASLSWDAPNVDAPVVFHYSGNDLLNATSVTL